MKEELEKRIERFRREKENLSGGVYYSLISERLERLETLYADLYE